MKKILFLIRAFLANIFYFYPSKKLKVIGVTGTDGKTTTSSLIYHILQISELDAGLISTVGAKIDNKKYNTGFHVTNLEPFQLQKLLSLMVLKKIKYAVLEVTSHGLDQFRNFGIKFEIGVLTNITHEHLDYHKTFENYVAAKAKLFQKSKVCIINEKYYKYFKKYIKDKQKVVLYNSKTLNINLVNIIKSKFKERYNLENATAAILVAKELGIEDQKISNAIKSFSGVEGRMQEIKNKRGIKIIVDFAHTPNALKNVLSTLKKEKSNKNKLISVFGCAGERDIQKRPMMGEISSRMADISIFTAEDPRHEDVNEIIKQMESGVKHKRNKIYKIPDRYQAIKKAIALAKKGDIVIICGKGHEKTMAFGDTEKPWNDIKIVKRLLGRL